MKLVAIRECKSGWSSLFCSSFLNAKEQQYTASVNPDKIVFSSVKRKAC